MDQGVNHVVRYNLRRRRPGPKPRLDLLLVRDDVEEVLVGITPR